MLRLRRRREGQARRPHDGVPAPHHADRLEPSLGDGTLDRKTRGLIDLAMLTPLHRAIEIKLHVEGALNDGVTVEGIKATLLHATACRGIPAGLDAFKAAHEVSVKQGAVLGAA